MLPQIHQRTQFPGSDSGGSTASPPNNTLPPPIIPYSLLSAFYALSSTNISTSPEINEAVEKIKPVGRSYNPGRPLCLEDRKKIVRLYEEGCRVSHIARLIGVTHSCVSKIMSRYRRTGSVQPRSMRSSHENQENDSSTWPKQAAKKTTPPIPLPFSIERLLSPDINKKPAPNRSLHQ